MYDFNKSHGLYYHVPLNRDRTTESAYSLSVSYDKNNNRYHFSEKMFKNERKIGSLLFEFLYTDFSIFENFLDFFSKYILAFISHFDRPTLKYLSSVKFLEEDYYLELARKTYNRIIDDINSVQSQANEVLALCFDDASDKKLMRYRGHHRFRSIQSSEDYIAKYPFLHPNNDFKIKYLQRVYTLKGMRHKLLDSCPRTELFPMPKYYTKNITSIICALIDFVFYYHIEVCKCSTCSRYFVSDSKKAKYCNYSAIDNPNKLCRVVSRDSTYKTKLEENSLEKEYRKVYKKKENLHSRYKDIAEYKEDFERIKIEGKAKRHEWKKGKISDEVFKKWLSKQI